MILLCIFLAANFIYFTSYHAQQFLAYLKVVIWPIVFILFLANFKDEIRILLRNIKQLGFLGYNVIIGAAESQTLAVEAASVAAQKANDSINETPSSLRISVSGIPDSDATLKRETFQRIIRSSAEWGHNMAVLGFQNTPIPQIKWNDDGTPQIEFGVESGQPVLSPHDQSDRDVLIKEILKIRREIESLNVLERANMGLGPTKESSLKAYLRDLEMRLRRIDPMSAFLPDPQGS